jgi:hypothetical protein
MLLARASAFTESHKATPACTSNGSGEGTRITLTVIASELDKVTTSIHFDCLTVHGEKWWRVYVALREVMLVYRVSTLLRRAGALSHASQRSLSNYYPIDEHLFGLTEEQKQVIRYLYLS